MEPHLIADAPLVHLLSLQHNPAIADMSTDELRAYLDRLKPLAQQSQTLSALLTNEAKARPTRASKPSALKTKLDALL